jgi:hypothetical protein
MIRSERAMQSSKELDPWSVSARSRDRRLGQGFVLRCEEVS